MTRGQHKGKGPGTVSLRGLLFDSVYILSCVKKKETVHTEVEQTTGYITFEII